MQKAILTSVSPQEALNLLTGNATLLLRKRVPKDFKGWVYCYVTKGKPYITMQSKSQFTLRDDNGYTNVINSTIPFKFWFDEHEIIYNEPSYHDDWLKYGDKAQVDFEDWYAYFTWGKDGNGYAWHIKQLEIFDKPMELGEFYRDFLFSDTDENGIEHNPMYLPIPVKRAPQSYQYVWVRE